MAHSPTLLLLLTSWAESCSDVCASLSLPLGGAGDKVREQLTLPIAPADTGKPGGAPPFMGWLEACWSLFPSLILFKEWLLCWKACCLDWSVCMALT